MKKFLLILSFIILSLELSGQIKMPVQYGQQEQGVAFIENVGQFRTYDGKPDTDVLYKAQMRGGAIYIRNSGISFVLEEVQTKERKSKHDEDMMLSPEIKPEPRHIKLSKTDMNFSGANRGLTITALEPLESYTNYYIGREEFTNVRSFRKILISNVYDKIDFAIYSNQINEPEYDFIVHPGGNPNDIALEFTNHEGISITDSNSLVIGNKLGTIEHIQPISYETNSDGINQVFSQYSISDNKVKFTITEYDRQKQLIIDPIIRIWSFAYGTKKRPIFPTNIYITGMDIDKKGNIIFTGSTPGTGLYTTIGALQEMDENGSYESSFLVKLSPNAEVLWATYISGEAQTNTYSVKVNNKNEIILGGMTWSKNFFTTKLIKDYRKDTRPGFILKISEEGKLIWGTYIVGSYAEMLKDIAIDKNYNIYAVGTTWSNEFFQSFGKPTREGQDVFIIKLTDNCEYLWSRILQGDFTDQGTNIALDSSGNVYALGKTFSKSMTGTSQTRNDSINSDIFYCKLDSAGGLLWTKILLSDGYEEEYDIQINSKGECVVVLTTNTYNMKANGTPITVNGLIKKQKIKGQDALILMINQNGNIFWSTFISNYVVQDTGRNYKVKEFIKSFTIDRFDNMYFAGTNGGDINYPEDNPIRPCHYEGDDSSGIFILKLTNKKEIGWYAYYGVGWGDDKGEQICIDSNDNIYVGGTTFDLPYEYGNKSFADYGVLILKIKYRFTVPGKLNGFCSNQTKEIPFLMAQKSDSLLNFKVFLIDSTDINPKPILIGEANADTSGVIAIYIPDSINTNKSYNLWITCSDSTITYHYPELITIKKSPEGALSGNDQPCLNNPTEYSVNLDNENYSYYWACKKGIVFNNGTNKAKFIIDSLGSVNIEVIVRDEQTGCERLIIKQVEVKNTTDITFTENPRLCWDVAPYLLAEGRPIGGKYEGEYVKDNYFDAKLSGSGIFNVKYIFVDTNGCVSENSYPITVFEKPTKPTITRLKDTLISSYETGNQWYLNDTIIQGATNKTLYIVKAGNYSVQITDSNDCQSEKSEIYIIITGIDDIQSEISIKPNPANDFIEICSYPGDIRIYDVLGVEVTNNCYNTQIIDSGIRINISSLTSGTYIVQIKNKIYKVLKY